MPSYRRFTALALARAMLAGPRSTRGLTARLQTCIARRADWCRALAERCARMPGERWLRLTPDALAALIENDTGYRAAWLAEEKPYARRYLLRVREHMNTLPLGLETCSRPAWPHSDAVARGLGISRAGLWRLTLPSAWQRRRPLGEQHYRACPIRKRSGGWRLLEIPHPYLMAVQQRLLHTVLDTIAPHEAACGYARGRSVLDHARAHVGHAVVLRFDLRDFFTCVKASRVHALFATLGYPAPVARELTALCTTATPEPVLRRLHENRQLDWPALQRLRDAHLPQGAPTSPALANLCAFRLDLRLQGLADALCATYTRYADDIVFSGDVRLRHAFARLEAWVGRIAREEGFALNHRKSRCLDATRRQSVCHIVVNRRPNLPRDEFDLLKAVLHLCVRDGPSAQNRAGIEAWQEHLRGRVAWAAQLNPGKARRLQRLFEAIDWTR